MAIDTPQKRMSAIGVNSSWRGAMVDATESGFNVGNRQAAALMYSGIAASGAADGGTLLLRNRGMYGGTTRPLMTGGMNS